MSARSLIMVLLALIFGVSAAVGVNSLLNNATAPKVETVPVVVASQDVPRGGNITTELLKVKEFPKDLVPAGILARPEDAVDRSVSVPITKDEPVLESKLAPKGAGRGLSALIPRGMRAYSVKVPDVAQGVAGFVLPGNRVDVLLSIGEIGGVRDESGGASTTTLLQNVEILAVDQKMDAPAENKVDANSLRSVTLLVTPQQANLLDLGQNKGMLHLALRNRDDDQAAKVQPATLADLRYRQEKPWDERARGVLDALGQALARRSDTPPPPPPAPPAPNDPETEPEPPKPVAIRTLRGAGEGTVMIQMMSPGPRAKSPRMGAAAPRN